MRERRSQPQLIQRSSIRTHRTATGEPERRRSGRSNYLTAHHNTKSILFLMKDGQIIDASKLPLAGGSQKRHFSGGV
jgi:hypothetical protein